MKLGGRAARWWHAFSGDTLARGVTASILSTTVAFVLFTALFSLAVTSRVMHSGVEERLRGDALRSAQRLSLVLEDAFGNVARLSRSSLVANSLVDSQGREAYVVPVIHDFRLTEDAPFRLALCDFLGRPIVTNGPEGEGGAPDPLVREAIGSGRPRVALRPGAGRPWLLFVQPVVYAGSGVAEGALVAEVELTDELLGVPSLGLGDASWRLLAPTGTLAASAPDAAWGRGLLTSAEPVAATAPLGELGLRLELGLPLVRAYRPLVVLVLGYLAGALALLLPVVWAARALATRLTRPLRRMSEAAHEIATADSSTMELPVDHRRETAQLAASFNEVLRRLREATAAQVAKTEQVQAANAELEAFSYSVSHDLRAPLRAIDGYTRILAKDYDAVLDEEGKRVCGVVRDEARRMGSLIDDLLAFSRLGRATLQPVPIDMERLVDAALAELRAGGRPAAVELRRSSLPASRGDPTLLRQVWVNLLSNAMKFSSKREGAVVEVSGAEAGGETVYTVRDNGAGFDMRYAQKLFGVFQRLHGEREFEGTGVGLAIVQRVVARHGGRVWAEGAVGRGAAFHFALPKERSVKRAA